ncbi:hypothetical protein [Namhaeicola litoreus]|uniref:Uncharacterized protein n=1 Tax=Namhaeicola litoreus TaxID=1052145 RepID=A0ABW3Y4W7_9FLAO
MGNSIKINSFEELRNEKQRLKNEIRAQEQSFRNNPIMKISNSLIGGFKSKSDNPFKHPLSFNKDVNLKFGAEGILSTLLLASKSTRKYFIAYTVAKEMIPFTIMKIQDFLKK